MADIKGLLADPEFRSLPSSDKRQLLSEADPEFSSLSDQEIESFATPTGVVKAVSDRKAFPKMGVMPTPTLADKLVALDVGSLEGLGRLPGELMSLNADIYKNLALGPVLKPLLSKVFPAQEAALNKAISQTLEPVQNITPKAFNALGGVTGLDINYNDPNAPQNVSPGYAGAGELLTNALLARGGGPIRGVSAGKALGGNLAGALRQPAEFLVNQVPKTLASSKIPGVTQVGNALERVAARGITKPIEDVVTSTIGIEPIEGGVDTATVALNRIVEKTGAIPSRTVGRGEAVIKQADATQKALIDESKAFLKAAEDEGLVVHGSPAVEEATSLIKQRFPSFAEGEEGAKNIESVLSRPEFKNLGDNMTPDVAQRKLVELNHRYDSLVDKKGPEGLAYRTIRDYLSDQVDGIIKLQSGKDISPYRDWGKVAEFKEGLRSQIRQAQGLQADKPIAGRGVPLSPRGAVTKAVRAVGGRPFVPREIEGIDIGVKTIADNLVKPSVTADLTEEAIAALRPNFAPRSIATESPQVPPPNLEKLIQSRMKNAPAKEKRSGMARLAAIQDLKNEGLIPLETPLQ